LTGETQGAPSRAPGLIQPPAGHYTFHHQQRILQWNFDRRWACVIFTLEIPQENSGDTIPDLINIQKANWNMAIEIVDLPIKNW
jgi:hypothetical protein